MDVILFQVRQQEDECAGSLTLPTVFRSGSIEGPEEAGRKSAMTVVKLVGSQADLLDIVETLCPSCGFAGRLNCR